MVLSVVETLVSFFSVFLYPKAKNETDSRTTIFTFAKYISLSTDPNIPSQSDTYVPKIYVAVGNDSIKIVTKNLTWDEANANCKADKASLASLRNEWSQAYIELLVLNVNAPVWIGLNKKQVSLHKNSKFKPYFAPLK